MYKISSKNQVEDSLICLTKGLFLCLQDQLFSVVTISEICEKAQVARRTYYRNCECKEDLIIFATHRLVEKQLQGVDLTSTDGEAMYHNFFLFWFKHKEFLRICYKNDLFALFTKEFITYCNQHMRYPLQKEIFSTDAKGEKLRNLNNAFTLGGLSQLLFVWASEDFKTSVDDVTACIAHRIPSVV